MALSRRLGNWNHAMLSSPKRVHGIWQGEVRMRLAGSSPMTRTVPGQDNNNWEKKIERGKEAQM